MKDKKLAILHLSDLHFGEHSMSSRVISAWYRLLIEDLTRQVRERPEHGVFLVIAGDITLSGKDEEFDVAATFLKRLLQSTGVRRDRVVLVPGNHDVSAGRRDDSPWHTFAKRMQGSQVHDADAEAPLCSFDEEHISFLLLDSTNDPYYPERKLARLDERIEAASRRQHSIIAVIHHLNRIHAHHMESMSDPLGRMLRKWSASVVLHGHQHSQSIPQAVEPDAWIALGAGPLSPERWRHDYGAPSYRILEFVKDQINTWRRTFVEQTNCWVHGVELPWASHRRKPSITASRPALLSSWARETPERDDTDQKRRLVEDLAALSVHGCDELWTVLRPNTLAYVPAREARVDFIVRLVEYFARQDSLKSLKDCLDKLRQVEGRDRSVVLVCGTEADGAHVEGLIQTAESLGFSARREVIGKKNEEESGEIANEVCLDDIDVLVLTLSVTALDGAATSDELQLAATLAFQKGIRVVLAVSDGCTIPAQLQYVPIIDLTRQPTAVRAQMADVMATTLAGSSPERT